jgi:hypothetical protein
MSLIKLEAASNYLRVYLLIKRYVEYLKKGQNAQKKLGCSSETEAHYLASMR